MHYKYISTLFLLALAFTSHAQHGYDPHKAVIWRGFNHSWTYNHRCNRIGDYVQLVGDSVFATHTSATGTGPDFTYDTSFYSTITTNDAVFLQGQDSFLIQGRKDSLIVLLDTVYIMAPRWMENKREYITLLNGFDLQAYNSEAEKPQALYLTIADAILVPSPTRDSVKLRLIIKAGASLNCTTPECCLLNHKVSYKLKVFFLIAGLEAKRAAASSQLFTTGHEWNKEVQLKQPPLRDFMEGATEGGYQTAVVGIKSFTLAMDKDHWLIQWNNSIELPGRYDADKAQINIRVNQLFVDWKLGMNHSIVPHSDASLSFKQRGWEIMNMDAVMLQFIERSAVKDHRIIGQMSWAGHNEPAGSASSVMVNSRPF